MCKQIIKPPTVSIIVPVFNVEKYIAHCLDTICAQTYANLEIILCYKDASDKSLVICRDYAARDTRIKLIQQRIPGLGGARDAGIEVATGEWICFVDSDDFIHPQYVELLLTVAMSYDVLTVKCRFSEVVNWDVDMSARKPNVRLFNWRDYFIYNWENRSNGYSPFCVWCNIYHRSLFDNLRFGALRFAEDSWFTPQIIYASRHRLIAVLDAVLYFYYQRIGSLLNSPTNIRILDRYKAKKATIEFWREKEEWEMYALFYNDFYNCMIMDYLNLCVDLPDRHKEYAFLYEEINRCLSEAQKYHNPSLMFYPTAISSWEKLHEEKEFVLYGYGSRGQALLPWLRYFQINVVEVWDQNAANDSNLEGIRFCNSHPHVSKDAVIMIAIDSLFVSYSAQIDLRKLGYKYFMYSSDIQEALKYGKYEKWLPFLLDIYKEWI